MKMGQLRPRKSALFAVMAVGFAQLYMVPMSAADDFQLKEIIVTAQKTDERIQDIPSTINLVSADTLSDLKLLSFADLSQVAAGLSLDVLTGRRQTVNLRGVQTNPDGGFQDGVAVYWNDLAVRTDVAFQQLFDIDRVEVLRGPQGTLQGQTSPAGAIQIHTKMPYLDGFSGDIQQTFSDNNGSNTEFGVDLPIIADKLAVRVAGVYDAGEINDIKDITTGRTATTMTRAGRISAVFQPGDIFTARLAYEYLEKFADGAEIVAGPAQAGNPALTPYDRKALASINNLNSNRNNLLSLNLQWDLGKNQVVWESGYYNSDQEAIRDSDAGNILSYDTTNLIPVKAERLVEEARLSTDISDDWQSLVGVYYQKDRSSALPKVNATAATVVYNDILSHGETYAVFTHQKYQITENGLIEGGLRYQKVNQFNSNFLRVYLLNGTYLAAFSGPQIPDYNQHDADAEVVTGSLKYSYTFSPDMMAYSSFDTSFRPGGVSPTTRQGLADALSYSEENSWGLEVGVKSAWLDNRVRLNGDIFYQKFSDGLYRSQALKVNTDGSPGTDGSTVRLVYNADSIIQGAELEAEGLITENWKLSGNVSYVDAKYDNARIPTNSPSPTTQQEVVYYITTSGRVGSEPNWSATASSYYTLPLGAVDGYANVLVKYQSSRNDDSFIGGQGYVGGFATTNLFVGVRDAKKSWDVSVWVKNLFNKDAQVVPPEVIDANTTYLLVRPTEPRTIGVTAKYNFGNYD